MLKSYFLAALRSFAREKSYALINILGLALAIASGIVLLVYVESEMTYDQHHVNHERIYRVVAEFTAKGNTSNFAIAPQVLGPLFKKDYPDMIDFVRFGGDKDRTAYKAGDIELHWDDVRTADPNVFDIFTHRAIYGDLATALTDPSSIAISETFSRAYFGDRNPVGETIHSEPMEYKVTAVFADLPDKTHLKYSALVSMKSMKAFGVDDENATPQRLFNIGIFTYFITHGAYSQKELQQSLDIFYETHASEMGERIQASAKFIAQPLLDVHFDSRWEYDQPTGNIFYVYVFIAVAVFILLIACINYTNLATARSSKRAKEVSMRKILGASRLQLMDQFIGESGVYACIALVVGLAMVYLAEAYTPMTQLLDRDDLLSIVEPSALALVIASTLLVAFISGAYPALYLSAIMPLSALTTTSGRKSGTFIRAVLVLIQFFVSVGVLSATLIMSEQMRFITDKPMGYEKDNRLVVTLHSVDTIEKIPVIKTELLKNSSVLGFTESHFVPGRSIGINLVGLENNEGVIEPTTVNNISVGRDFVEVMGVEIVKGRDFSRRLLTDVGRSIVVNESLVEVMGWEEPIGKRAQYGNGRVVGVMKDFHFASLHQSVAPMMIMPMQPDDFSKVSALVRGTMRRNVIINIAPEDSFRTINYIESVISKFDSKHPFEYRFVNDLLDDIYADEKNLMTLTAILAGICIFISTIGLYGLAAFTTEQRTKEIGIRKILGASTMQIILLLSKSTLMLMLVAAALGSLASYVAMNEWLNAFAYRTDIGVWIFLLSSFAVALVAFIAVTLQTYSTASASPSEAIRYE